MTRIQAVSVRDYKRIASIELEGTDRALVVVGGRNRAGKSSILDAIAEGLAGREAAEPMPIRRGAEDAEVTITLTSGIVIRKRLAKSDSGIRRSLQITTADGMRAPAPQSWLSSRLGQLAHDPLAFLRLGQDEQAARLRTVAGVDVSDLDAARAKVYAARTDTGRDGKRLAGAVAEMPHYPDAPAEEVQPDLVSAADISAELEAATATVAVVDAAKRAESDARRDLAGSDHMIERCELEIQELQRRLDAKRAELSAHQKLRLERLATVQAAEEATERAQAAIIDAAPIRARLASVEAENRSAIQKAAEVNRQVRANAARAAKDAEAEQARELYRQQTAEIQRLDGERQARLAAATWPVPGLSLADDGTVLYQDVPLSQASGAEQLRVSMAIALAGSPEIGVVLIRDGSLLDDDSMGLVLEMAEERGAQVWIERVGTGDEGAVIIEDGGVV